MPDDFDQIRPTAPETEQVSAQRVLLQDLLNLQRETRKAAPHIRIACREPNTDAGWKRDHRDRRPSLNARSAAANVASFMAPVTRIRAPFAKSISIVPGSGGAANSGVQDCGSTVIVAGTNPAGGFAVSFCAARNARRHSCNCQREMPWRRAVAATWRGD